MDVGVPLDNTVEAWVYNADMDSWKGPSRLNFNIESVPLAHNGVGAAYSWKIYICRIHRDNLRTIHRATMPHAPNVEYVAKQTMG